MKNKRKSEPKQEINLSIYQNAGGISGTGELERYPMNVVVSNLEWFSEFSGDARTVARDLAEVMAKDYNEKSGDSIRLEFASGRSAITFHVDGFFRRPMYFDGALFLKPLPARRQNALYRELKKIVQIVDKKGRVIPVRIEYPGGENKR